MTDDLRPWAEGSVGCDPVHPTRPTATVKVKTAGGAAVVLRLQWHEETPVAWWAVDDAASSAWSFTDLLFRKQNDEGEEWKAPKQTPAPVAPSQTAVVGRLLLLAQQWEAMPPRSADRLARLVGLALGPVKEEGAR